MAVTVTPVASAPLDNIEQWRPLVSKYFPSDQVDNALRVIRAESGGNPTMDNTGLNTNGTVDYGLMQINTIHAGMVNGDLEKLRDPETNISVAIKIYNGRASWDVSGWCAWSSSHKLGLCQ